MCCLCGWSRCCRKTFNVETDFVPCECELRLKIKLLTLRQIVFPEIYKLGTIFKPLHWVDRL